MTKLQAHRGVSSEFPENTMAAFVASVEQGYDFIEFDPKYTKDGEIVILHDRTLNRTARRSDGSVLESSVTIHDVTLDEARMFEYGSWFSKDFAGEQIPLLTDLLDFASKTKIPIKVDNVWETFPDDMKEKMFSQIAEYGESINVGFTCAHIGHELYIWVCFDNDMTGWFKGTKANKEVCELVEKYGKLGIWILSKREELTPAVVDFNAHIIETTGHIKPEWIKEFD